ncbi:hypothetical protein [Embleya sp. NPDC020630]|uniref:hypothetical protein n=1 Tax=Embleya sp. NPDC020630 TaxID=3363979 RepID=UPI0037982198
MSRLVPTLGGDVVTHRTLRRDVWLALRITEGRTAGITAERDLRQAPPPRWPGRFAHRPDRPHALWTLLRRPRRVWWRWGRRGNARGTARPARSGIVGLEGFEGYFTHSS